MVLLNVRVSAKLLDVMKQLAEYYKVSMSVVVRDALHAYLQTPKFGLEQLSREAEIDQLVKQLDFLDRTQRKMLRSGAFLAKSLPRDWSPAKRWATTVKGEERMALELLLGEREYLASRIAALVKATYTRKARIVLLDRSPWYKILPDNNGDGKETAG